MTVPGSATHYIYMLRCSNDSIYVGQTRDIKKRLNRHKTGSGARHTAKNKPIELIHREGPMTHAQATTRERQLKQWSRGKKLALARQDFGLLQSLSKRRQK